mmetsp:Transcript_39387/g.63079  ORF Transcript_39387/g.63079 Transcript_39387/m.63079 type:complete len:186 (-) Transcript_39387:103-660(-)
MQRRSRKEAPCLPGTRCLLGAVGTLTAVMMESACERRAACYVTLACYLDEISLRNRTRGIHNEGALGAYSYLLTGSPEQMYSNFMKLGKLPKDTLVYCGHEYTLKNLAYASYADPENVELKERVKWAEERRKAGLPTVPSTIKDEWETNPFLRVDTETIRKYAKTTDGAKAMKFVRADKDAWGRR